MIPKYKTELVQRQNTLHIPEIINPVPDHIMVTQVQVSDNKMVTVLGKNLIDTIPNTIKNQHQDIVDIVTLAPNHISVVITARRVQPLIADEKTCLHLTEERVIFTTEVTITAHLARPVMFIREPIKGMSICC